LRMLPIPEAALLFLFLLCGINITPFVAA